MKLRFTALAVGVLGACALIGGCGSGSNKQFTKDEFYGVGAVSCVEILGSSLNAKSVATLAAMADGDVKDEAETFNKYFSALNSFLDGSALTVETSENTDNAYSQFETKLTVNGRDIAGNATQYILYYNETYNGQITDGKETETSYLLDGAMVYDGAEYRIKGGRTLEVERGETEEELKIRAYMDETTGDFVEMKYEGSVEDNERETEYVYRVYSGNKLVEETSVEFETENKNGRIENEYELKFVKGDARGKYKVEREVKNGVTEISVKYNLDGKNGKFKIKETVKDGQTYYEYIFDDNSRCTFEKHGKS